MQHRYSLSYDIVRKLLFQTGKATGAGVIGLLVENSKAKMETFTGNNFSLVF